MCLIVFSYKQHPEYDLIFAANRDESYGRPTKPAHYWAEHPRVLAGRDLKAGGTWMGINRDGVFSAVTNYRDMKAPPIVDDPPSRGHLVLDYLIEGGDPENYLKRVAQRADLYDGFNLLAGTTDKLMYYSNRQNKPVQLEPGLYGLSNHLLNTPWPKVEQARADLDLAIRSNEISEEVLFEILKNDRPASDDKLPKTGLPLDLERAVSSVFIKTEGYGTRASTLLLIDKEGQVSYTERLYGPEIDHEKETNRFEFAAEVENV